MVSSGYSRYKRTSFLFQREYILQHNYIAAFIGYFKAAECSQPQPYHLERGRGIFGTKLIQAWGFSLQ